MKKKLWITIGALFVASVAIVSKSTEWLPRFKKIVKLMRNEILYVRDQSGEFEHPC